MERLAGLTSFIRTVELGSQAAAAEALGLSRMAVSRQIQALEQRLGVRLLQRTTRSQTLTEAGTVFFSQARLALESLEDAADQAAEFQTTLRGKLRISSPVSFTMRSLSPLLARFSERYPELQIDLELNDRQVDLIEDGFDLALRIGRLEDSSLVSRRLARFPVIPCAAPAYLDVRGVPLTPSDLLSHNCLVFARSDHAQSWSFAGAGGAPRQAVAVRGNLVSNNGDALLAAALAGQGIILQPSFIVEQALKSGELVRVLPDEELRWIELHAVFPAARLMPAKLRRMLDFLVAAYREAGATQDQAVPPAGAPT